MLYIQTDCRLNSKFFYTDFDHMLLFKCNYLIIWSFFVVLLFFIIFFCTAFVLPSVRIYRVSGVSPVTFKNSGSAHDLVGFYMKVLMLLVLVSSLHSLPVDIFQYAQFFNDKNLVIIGWILMVASLLFMCTAQLQMKDSWRIGIDQNQKTILRTKGIFSVTRNPIFAAIIIALLGNFLVYSTVLNLIILVIGILLVTIQIRLEEEHLLKIHQQDYIDYKNKVKRRLFF